MINKKKIDIIPEIMELYKNKKVTSRQIGLLSGLTVEQQKLFYSECTQKIFLEWKNKNLEKENCRIHKKLIKM